jgi:hypothetical protein
MSLRAPLARTQSKRRRRLALAGGFRLLRLSGIDRLDAPGHMVGRGSIGSDGWCSALNPSSCSTLRDTKSLGRA